MKISGIEIFNVELIKTRANGKEVSEYHTVDAESEEEALRKVPRPTDDELVAAGFSWGVSARIAGEEYCKE